MTVKAILELKGHDVVTLGPNERLSDAIRILTERRIGALVITNGDRKIVGILSERDIVRALAKAGATALDHPVREAMTAKVKICNEHHTVNEVMEIMTVKSHQTCGLGLFFVRLRALPPAVVSTSELSNL
jgi:CBS domain-containing protein